jgi:23S rRNA (pseudouridine1915-N3)-methyltransferase
MLIYIISTNHKLDKLLINGIEDFSKRLLHWKIVHIELKPSIKLNTTERMLQEAKSIQKNIVDKSCIVILDEKGKSHTTVDFANMLQNIELNYNSVCFIIGGADGLHESIRSISHHKIQLSNMTLPHGFAKLLLVEQIYRAWTIKENHPYHRV